MPPPLFGDLLALARLSWVRQMDSRLEERGHPGYRRSDALVMRLVSPGPVSIGRLGSRLGVSRQAARKVVDSLVGRGYALVERDPDDSRKLNVVLTAEGRAYAAAVIEVIQALNDGLASRVSTDDLSAADRVLRAVGDFDREFWGPAGEPGAR